MEYLRLISLNKSRDNSLMTILFNGMNIITKEKNLKPISGFKKVKYV